MAHAETILYNHRPENIDDPHARWGITAENPLWEELRARERPSQDRVFYSTSRSIATSRIIGAFAGEVDRAHREGCAFVRDRCMAATEEPADIVLTTNSGYPLDQNLYQAVKGLAAAEEIVRPGGTIIMAAECSEGVPDGSPYHRLLAGASDLAELLQTIRNHRPTLCEGWQVQIHARICLKAKVHFYSDGTVRRTNPRGVLSALPRPRGPLDSPAAGKTRCAIGSPSRRTTDHSLSRIQVIRFDATLGLSNRAWFKSRTGFQPVVGFPANSILTPNDRFPTVVGFPAISILALNDRLELVYE